MIDTAGFPKDAYYTFAAEWTNAKKNPMVHVFPYWDFNEGQMIDVRICSNGAKVELLLNGISLGTREIDHCCGTELLGTWKVPYEKGEITAIAYDENGIEIARQSRHSFGDSAKLCVTANKEVLNANGEDLCYLTISTIDAEGNPVENAMDYVTVEVSGQGRLLGLDNGDSTDYDQYKCNIRKLFNGKLLAVIGTTSISGEIAVTISAPNLEAASIVLQSKQAETRHAYIS